MNYEPGSIEREQRLQLAGPDDGERARRRRRLFIIAAVVLALIVAFAAWRARSKPAGEAGAAATQQLPTVSVAAPGRQSVARVLSATGSLAARRDMPVGVAGEGGIVTRVLVEPGTWVKAGQVLATVDRSVQVETAASLAAQVKVAEADATLAQSQLDRAKQLVSNGFISKADIDNRVATRDAAMARVKVARAQLAETGARNRRLDIRAPASGLVLTRAVEAGQIVSSASGALFRVAENGELEMRAALSEGDLATVRVGAPAQVTPVGGTTSFAGRVWQVSPVIDPQTRQGFARVLLSYNPALRPGGFATAAITAGETVAPQLPNSAIQSDEKGNFVYVVGAGNKVERRAIKIGEVSDNGVSVADGLRGDERVVLSAGAFLNPGQQVKPVVQTLSKNAS